MGSGREKRKKMRKQKRARKEELEENLHQVVEELSERIHRNEGLRVENATLRADAATRQRQARVFELEKELEEARRETTGAREWIEGGRQEVKDRVWDLEGQVRDLRAENQKLGQDARRVPTLERNLQWKTNELDGVRRRMAQAVEENRRLVRDLEERDITIQRLQLLARGSKGLRLTATRWKTLMLFCHPDRQPENMREKAGEIARWLNSQRPS